MGILLDTNVIGLDISDGALRLVWIRRANRRLRLEAWNELRVPPGVMSEGVIHKPEDVKHLISSLFATAHGKRVRSRTVVTVLPETKTFLHFLELPVSARANLASAVEEESAKFIPLEPQEMFLDWQITDQDPQRLWALVGAVPRDVSESYWATLNHAGLNPEAFEIEAAAICRCVLPVGDQVARLVLDLGAARTGLVIAIGENIAFSVSVPISGNALTQTISTTLQISPEEAELAKSVCGLDPVKCSGALRKVLDENVRSIAGHVTSALSFYNARFSNHPVEEILLCGGGANMPVFDQALRQRVGLPVTRANPMQALTGPSSLQIPSASLLSFTTAIGLALRGCLQPPLI